jgi:hypothetical protein
MLFKFLSKCRQYAQIGKKMKKLSFLLIVSSFCELIFLGCVTFCLADRLHGSVKKVLQN